MKGEELKKIREKLGMNRDQFGDLLGAKYRTIQNYELDARPIPSTVINLLDRIVEEKEIGSTPWSDTPITLFDWSAFLAHKKLTQMELAEVLDVKQPYISQMKREFEKGRPVPEGLLDRMREVFDSDEIEPFVRQSKVKSRKDGTVIDIYQSMRPYYDIDFFGTPGAELLDPAGRLKPDNYISVPHFTDVDFYTRVTGDSMYPKFRHGDIIACKAIDTAAFFAFYEPYAIVTRTNNQRLIKYIHPHPNDPDKLLLVSYDSEKFPPQPIHRDEVMKLFQIKGKIEL